MQLNPGVFGKNSNLTCIGQTQVAKRLNSCARGGNQGLDLPEWSN